MRAVCWGVLACGLLGCTIVGRTPSDAAEAGSGGDGGSAGGGGTGGTLGSGGSGGSGGVGSGGSGGSARDSGSSDSRSEPDSAIVDGVVDSEPGDAADAPGAADSAIDAPPDVILSDARDGGTSDVRPDSRAGNALLYVVGGGATLASDTTLINRLTGRGYEVTIRTDAAVRAADAQGKAAVLLSASTTAGIVMATFPELPTLATPVIAMDDNLEPFLNFTGAAAMERNTAANQTQVTIVAGADATLTAGLSGNVTVYNTPFAVGWGAPGAGALRVATIVGVPGRVALYAYPTGSAMVNNQNAPARRAFYLVQQSTAANLITEAALALFDAQVDWATR